jgi:hypothetical protein
VDINSSIFLAIRRKALSQYFSPHSSLRLATMAAHFITTIKELEGELIQMIKNNDLNAKIDQLNQVFTQIFSSSCQFFFNLNLKTIVAVKSNEKDQLITKVLEIGRGFELNCNAALFRVCCAQSEVNVSLPRSRMSMSGELMRKGKDQAMIHY